MVDNAAMSALLPSIDRAALLAACNAELRPEQFKDYGPNGLQVEGRPRIGKIVSGVTASRALIDAAIAAGADAFITGEISEPQAHLARETGVAFIAAGHHATERYGAPAVAAHMAAQYGLEHQFIDIANPA